MKVLIVSEPGVDGVFRYVEGLCRFLLASNISVDLAYSDRRGCDRLHYLVRLVKNHGGQALNLGVSNSPSIHDFRAAYKLYQAIKHQAPDIVHSHSSKAGVLARGVRYAGLRSIQVYTPHAYYGLRPGRGGLRVVYNAIESFLGRHSQTIACSKSERQFAIQKLGLSSSRAHHVYNGVDTGVFTKAEPQEKRDLRNKFGLPLTGKILGFMGRSSAQKDPQTLYKAFSLAARVHPDLSLFHVGSGDLDRELERFVDNEGLADRIFRFRYMEVPKDFYRCVDAFALPSRYEGFSLAALEALSCNLPLILSRCAGNMDLLSFPLSHVWSANTGDVDGFAACISEWAQEMDPTRGCNHRQTAIKHFSANTQYEEILNLYRSYMNSPSLSKDLASNLMPTGSNH